jgi:predicted acetyltransferase
VRVKYARLDPAWSPFLFVADPRRLHLSITEGLWLRLVDLEGALRARGFREGATAVLEVVDDVLTGNSGRWEIGPDVRRTHADADVGVGVADLASAYLGAFSFEQLALAGRAHELRPGGLRRASELFMTPLPPYCPEGF